MDGTHHTTQVQWNLSKADRRTPLEPTKIVHYREGVLWSGVYFTLCGLYLGFSVSIIEGRGVSSKRGFAVHVQQR